MSASKRMAGQRSPGTRIQGLQKDLGPALCRHQAPPPQTKPQPAPVGWWGRPGAPRRPRQPFAPAHSLEHSVSLVLVGLWRQEVGGCANPFADFLSILGLGGPEGEWWGTKRNIPPHPLGETGRGAYLGRGNGAEPAGRWRAACCRTAPRGWGCCGRFHCLQAEAQTAESRGEQSRAFQARKLIR